MSLQQFPFNHDKLEIFLLVFFFPMETSLKDEKLSNDSLCTFQSFLSSSFRFFMHYPVQLTGICLFLTQGFTL